MGQVIDRAKERIVLGIRAGGQMPMAMIEVHIIRALNEMYMRTEMVKTAMEGIDEVTGTKEYAMPTLNIGNFVRLSDLCRVTYDGGGEINSSVEIAPEQYTQGLIVPADGITPQYEAVTLLHASGRDYVGGLLPYAIAAYDTDAHIPAMHLEDSIIAVGAKVVALVSAETGKPWSDNAKAIAETAVFNSAVSRMKNKTIRGGTGRNLRMKSTRSFT